MKKLGSVGRRLVLTVLMFGCALSGFSQTNAEVVTTLSGDFGPMAVSGNYLFAAGSSFPPAPALRIFEISDPAHPVDLGYQDGGGTLSGVWISGSYAYVCCDYFGGGYDLSTRILDISNPTNPVAVAEIDGPWQRASLAGRYAYLLGLELAAFEVSNPASPTSVGHAPAPRPDHFSSVLACGDYVYIVDPHGLLTYDASNPAELKQVKASAPFGAGDAALSGNYLYVPDLTNGFWICDVSSRTNPVIVYYSGWQPEAASAFAVSGNYAYLSSFSWGGVGSGRLRVYDISNPTNATLVGQCPIPLGYFTHLAVAGNFAYTSSSYGGLVVCSLGAPAPPPVSISTTRTNSILISWPTPTPAFAVQQNFDLSPTNWVTLPNTPAVVDGKNQVTLPKPEGTMFYRLSSQ